MHAAEWLDTLPPKKTIGFKAAGVLHCKVLFADCETACIKHIKTNGEQRQHDG